MRRRNIEHTDARGSFTELWRASLTAPLDAEPMVQANLSRSSAGTLRGMHFHLNQADLWFLVEGEAAAATTDLRPVLNGGAPLSQVVRFERGDALYIPRLVAHGFLALTDVALVYLVSREYDASDEHGFAWDDPAAGIEWPAVPEIVSGRDLENPALNAVIDGLLQRDRSAGA